LIFLAVASNDSSFPFRHTGARIDQNQAPAGASPRLQILDEKDVSFAGTQVRYAAKPPTWICEGCGVTVLRQRFAIFGGIALVQLA
jgi:hypothetical protein